MFSKSGHFKRRMSAGSSRNAGSHWAGRKDLRCLVPSSFSTFSWVYFVKSGSTEAIFDFSECLFAFVKWPGGFLGASDLLHMSEGAGFQRTVGSGSFQGQARMVSLLVDWPCSSSI